MLRQLISSMALMLAVLTTAYTLASEAPRPPEELPVRQSTIPLPQVVETKLTRQFKQGQYSVVVDLSQQKLQLDLPKEIDWRQKRQIIVGDVIRVKRNWSLRRLTSNLAPVRLGQHLTVHRVHEDGKWVEAGVVADGKLVRGWLPIDDVEFVAAETPLLPSLNRAPPQEFASAGTLAHKAKMFDDGLMAAVQLAAQTGLGKFAGKARLLEGLAQKLGAEESGKVVLAACLLGNIPTKISPANRPSVDALIAEFLGNAARSKPIAFYTWNKKLSDLFQQDRMLQSDLTDPPGTDALTIAKALQGDAASRRAYESYLTLQSRLTNPQISDDLRPLLAALDAGRIPEVPAGTRFFPASYSHEIDLLKRLFPDGLVPPDFHVMDELVKLAKSGKLDLTPRPDSGWYDQQIWSLEPYLKPEKMPEGSRWKANAEYHEHLTKLFKGVWALARETHIKDLELYPAAEAAGQEPEPKIEIRVQPQLSAEPVATSYLRRALGYRFVRNLLSEQFGTESLKQLHRLTVSGPVAQNLDDELRQMEAVFYGAFVTTTRQLGLVEKQDEQVGSGAGSEADSKSFLTWAANLHRDPDLGTDARMMVPLYYDPIQKKTKVWAFLGWTTQRVSVGFDQSPAITVLDKAGQLIDPKRLEVSYWSDAYTIATPAFHEVWVTKLLNRDEFRRHCDAYESTTAILKNLE